MRRIDLNKTSSQKNITTSGKGYHVRIMRRTKEISRYFSFGQYGHHKKALQEARAWRDSMIKTLKNSTRRFLKPLPQNKSTRCTGISRTISYDKRRGEYFVNYAVCWTDSRGKLRNKKFHVGNADTFTTQADKRAFLAAKIFRRNWERHADLDTLAKFDPRTFQDWREERISDLQHHLT